MIKKKKKVYLFILCSVADSVLYTICIHGEECFMFSFFKRKNIYVNGMFNRPEKCFYVFKYLIKD